MKMTTKKTKSKQPRITQVVVNWRNEPSARAGYIVSIAAGYPQQWSTKVGWDTVWATRAEAEACADRARTQDGWSARVVVCDPG